jgi:hypothetical protein
MRVWADIFTNTNVKVGSALELTGASATKALDGAGTFNMSFPAASESVFDLIQLERKVRIYVEQDEQTRLFGTGIIRSINVDESNGGAKVSVSGPDSLDALTRRNVLLRRVYEIEQLATVAADLIGLVPDWAIVTSEEDLITARFDGVSVMKALIRLAQESGLHIREGESPNVVELGAFGDDNGVRALKPNSMSVELNSRDDVLLIDKIAQKSSSHDVVNWIIPLGAGEGTAALTLEYCVNVTPETMEAPDGTTLYFLQDVDSIATYGQIEKVVTFKDIVTTINDQAVKVYASEKLYAAAAAWLERNAQPLVTYSLSAKKCRTAIRPGDKIRIAYKGLIETASGSHTYLDINDLFWVMKITETISDSGMGVQLEVNTIDREDKNQTTIQSDAVEAIAVRNLGTATYPVWISKERTDVIWGSPTPGDEHERIATFYLDIDDGVTDVTQVKLHFVSEPAYTTADVVNGAWANDYWAYYTRAPNHPQDISLFINGNDATIEYGGPWGTISTAADVEIDITDKIREAAGGIYQRHIIEFRCVNVSGERSYPPHTTASGNGASGGMILCEIKARLVVSN